MAYFVENCWELAINKLGKGILNPAGDKTGKAFVLNQTNLLIVDFKITPGPKPKVDLTWEMDGGIHHDALHLTIAQLTFGRRVYWLCSMCGNAAFKIFHRPGYFGWSCAPCLGLSYLIQYCNKNTTPGRIQYWMNRLNKIKEMEIGLKRCPTFYRNKPTKRFSAYFKSKVRWTVSKAAFDSVLASFSGTAVQSLK